MITGAHQPEAAVNRDNRDMLCSFLQVRSDDAFKQQARAGTDRPTGEVAPTRPGEAGHMKSNTRISS